MANGIDFLIAVIDASTDIVDDLTRNLRTVLRRAPSDLVMGYAGLAQLKDHVLSADNLSVPLVVIADSAARMPSVEEGAFVFCKQIAPRCRTIFYSTSLEGWDELSERNAVDNTVRSGTAGSFGNLARTTQLLIDEFHDSLDCLMIERFAHSVRSTPSCNVSSIDDEDGRFSPASMLIQMARGTIEGKEYLRNMHMEWVRSQLEVVDTQTDPARGQSDGIWSIDLLRKSHEG